MTTFQEFVLSSAKPLAMPLAVYPGTQLTGWSVRDVVTNPVAQCEVICALHRRYGTPVVFTAMDLSAEAEAFGCPVQLADHEVPTTTGPAVTEPAQIEDLRVPSAGDRRTRVYLDTAARLRTLSDAQFVFGGCIGPFTLATRLIGLSEACQLTVTEPELMHALLEKTTSFLCAYVRAFRDAGAHGVIMAEPAAGLLSPAGFGTFSSAYVKRIIGSVGDAEFTLVFHCCAARPVHLSAARATGAGALHFGVPMNMSEALAQLREPLIVCGNIDPVAAFVLGTPQEIESRVAQLLETARGNRNFVVSSGCDVPAAAPLANLDAFYSAAATARA